MSTQSIDQIRTLRDEIRTSVKGIKASHFKEQKFGPEQEYTARGIKGGVEATLLDLTALTKSTAKFIQVSTHGERSSLISDLSQLNTYLINKDLAATCTHLDNVKITLRSWGIRNSFERQEVMEEHVNTLQKKALILTEQIEKVIEIKEQSLLIKGEIESAHSTLLEERETLQGELDKLDQLVESTTLKRSEIESLLTQDADRSEQIEALLSDAKSHGEVIDTFSEKVLSRETQLEKQEQTTKTYTSKLGQFKTDHLKYLGEAKALIESAKLALEYKTAEGLSAAFTEQFTKASAPILTVGWIVLSGIFVISSVSMGIWLVSDTSLGLGAIVGRISLLPILIGGAWFSAGQYVKQKNIAEDYAYKSTLAKSIVGFSDQLSGEAGKGEEYSHYIKSVLTQIHNDPLRKHGSTEDESGRSHTKNSSLSSDLKNIHATLRNLESKISDIEA